MYVALRDSYFVRIVFLIILYTVIYILKDSSKKKYYEDY